MFLKKQNPGSARVLQKKAFGRAIAPSAGAARRQQPTPLQRGQAPTANAAPARPGPGSECADQNSACLTVRG